MKAVNNFVEYCVRDNFVEELLFIERIFFEILFKETKRDKNGEQRERETITFSRLLGK